MITGCNIVELNAFSLIVVIPPNDEIWYTSVDDQIVASLNKDIYGANIISNTYENGKGVIKFDRYITAIGSNAFEERFYLTSITLPNSITSIGVRAFSNYPNLTNVYIGDGVTLINDYAFNGCLQLDNVTIPNSVTTIGNSAFSKLVLPLPRAPVITKCCLPLFRKEFQIQFSVCFFAGIPVVLRFPAVPNPFQHLF